MGGTYHIEGGLDGCQARAIQSLLSLGANPAEIDGADGYPRDLTLTIPEAVSFLYKSAEWQKFSGVLRGLGVPHFRDHVACDKGSICVTGQRDSATS